MSNANAAVEFVTVEVWVLVDDGGDYEVGTSDEDVCERFGSNIGSSNPNRMVRLTVKVPKPKTVQVHVTVPDRDDEAAEVSVG